MPDAPKVDQQWEYAFQFSLPIQAVAPLSRDPNLRPLPADNAYHTESDSDAAAAERRPPTVHSNRLTTVNMDVQILIMSLLHTPDLSALMRTCRYLLDTGLLALCARIPQQVLKHGARVASFYEFLRAHAGPLSRTYLITDLHFNLPFQASDYWDTPGDGQRAQHVDAFLGILRSCRNLRRLRIDGWFKDLPASLLLHTLATSLLELEELSLAIPRRDVVDKDLRKLGRLRRARKITIQASSFTSLHTLQPLAGALVELDRIRIREDDTSLRFRNVQTLGVWTGRDAAWLERVSTTFPNVAVLLLRPRIGSTVQHQCYDDEGRAEDDSLRDHNKLQWRSTCANAWPSLRAIWTHNLCGLYCLGVSRHIDAISVPLERPDVAHFLPVLLADTQPGLLELRVDLLECGDQPDGLGLVTASTGSMVPRLTLSIDVIYHQYRCQEKALLETLARGLCNLSLTHLLVRYRVGSSLLTAENATLVAAFAPEHARLLAQSSPTLRWVGMDICGLGLRCWEVSRSPSPPSSAPSGATEKVPHAVTLVQLSEQEGRRTMEAESMDVFATIRP
ncbi:hypothetical protein K466DRAFT_652504 [Polyporus arcularius HHB13444]|uniref:Uncharacterized protein n=1 Tax=Polyporus arcularius HHB13444 TaxID=1314778 RepID=A0A5C3PHE3_9APHY|nr:hypothetical protein K466DRAFT_652504 [Polyporus arcularius HHB13444]